MGIKRKKGSTKKTESKKKRLVKNKQTKTRKSAKTVSSVKKTPKSKKDTTTISRNEAIKSIKAELLKQKKILLGEAGATINNMPAAILYPDLGDQAGMEMERNFLLRLRGREQRLLKKIDEALEKIENGTFGFCEVCGKEIDIRRLMARPVTTMCIECKIEQEEEERLREI